MAYIGNKVGNVYGAMSKQDITGDGGTGYTLSYSVANANEIAVYVNNVRQEPTSAYSASGTTLTMTGNVASTDDFYVIYLGRTVGTINPPDNSVGTATITNNAVTNAKIANDASISGSKLGAGAVIQVVNYTTTAVNNLGDALIPYDDTIPQNTEGGEVMTLAITPTSSSSKLLIDVIVNHSTTLSGEKVVTALFQDSNANALACSCSETYDSAYMNTEYVKHYMTSGTTSATTFKVRIGRTDSHSNPFTINGYNGSRKFGGVSSTSITIMEIGA